MPWIQIRIACDAKKAEKYSTMMTGLGAQAVTFMDAQDNPVYEPKLGETLLWGETQVMGLFDAAIDVTQTTTFLQKHLPKDAYVQVEQLEDKDWVKEWMQYFEPLQFGTRLWICPSWKAVPDPDAVNVMLDPGLAFGTGSHPTTSLCLQWLDATDLTDKDVVDYGCGSGILSLAALKLGAKQVMGVDIDPQALAASRDNAERNSVSDRLTTYLPQDEPSAYQADILIANILAGPLRELAPLFADKVKEGGSLVLSGLLESQAEELIQVYSPWFDMDPPVVKDEWVRLHGTRRLR